MADSDFLGLDVLIDVLTAEKPPETCPVCETQAKEPKKNEQGYWTWNCEEGCNP